MMSYKLNHKSWWSSDSALLHGARAGAVLVGIGVLVYLAMVNRTATLGLEIRELERSKEQLREASQKLEVATLKMQSLDYVAEQSQTLGLVRPRQIVYLEATVPPKSLSVRTGMINP